MTPRPTPLRLATRSSALAVWQAEHLAALLRAAHPGLDVELVRTDTVGDRRQDVPISEIGGKGVFATEVQRLVLDGAADAAVHSAKDLPAVTGTGLALAAVPERGDPRDALVGSTLGALVEGATVATGSQRRRVQVAALRPDLRFVELRGNIATRLGKVPDGGAIIVAATALERLALTDRIAERFDVDVLVPQVGQGALAVECRADDDEIRRLVAAVEDRRTRLTVDAERAYLAALGGDCDLPAGAHATLAADGSTVTVRGVLASDDGTVHRRDVTAPAAGANDAAADLATTLRARAG